jgi:hypothetical protein
VANSGNKRSTDAASTSLSDVIAETSVYAPFSVVAKICIRQSLHNCQDGHEQCRTCQRRMLPRHTPPAHSQTPATAPQTTPPPPARPASYLPPEEREKQGVRKDVRSFLETSLDKTGVMSVLLPQKTENAAHQMGTTRCGPFSFFKQAISGYFNFIHVHLFEH